MLVSAVQQHKSALIMCVLCVLVTQLCPTLCDPMDYIACQVSLSMEFSRREYWCGLPFPSPEELPNPGIEPWSPALQADSLLFELREVCSHNYIYIYIPSCLPLPGSHSRLSQECQTGLPVLYGSFPLFYT